MELKYLISCKCVQIKPANRQILKFTKDMYKKNPFQCERDFQYEIN